MIWNILIRLFENETVLTTILIFLHQETKIWGAIAGGNLFEMCCINIPYFLLFNARQEINSFVNIHLFKLNS